MEAATVARRPAAAAAPAPAAPKRRPRGRPAPGKRTSTRRTTALKRSPAKRAAPAKRSTRKRSAVAAPARPKRAPASPRRAPARTKRAPAGRPQLIPIAVGTATLVKELPDSSLIVRLTRGRAWIALLGVLLAGIVALNVFTLSISATAGQVDQNIVALEKDNSLQRSRDAMLSGSAHVRNEAGALGLTMAPVDEVNAVHAGGDDLEVAVERLAAAGNGY